MILSKLIDELVTDVDSFEIFLDKIAKELDSKVQVVAHSMGGLITLVTLNRRPELFHSVLFAGKVFYFAAL